MSVQDCGSHAESTPATDSRTAHGWGPEQQSRVGDVSPPRDMGAVAVGTGAHRSQPVHFGTVERRALRERLHAASTNRLTLVSAPAGFGKSALLQELRSAHPETVRL